MLELAPILRMLLVGFHAYSIGLEIVVPVKELTVSPEVVGRYTMMY